MIEKAKNFSRALKLERALHWSTGRLANGFTKRRLALAAGFACLMAVSVLLADHFFPLPLSNRRFATVVTSADGGPLRAFADDEGVWRYPVGPDQVSPLYLEALLGYEDRWFRSHPGVNPLAVVRAAWQNLTAGRVVSGGSTLTMQTARLMDPHARSLAGKIKQMLRALQLERHWSKDRILTYYLNHAPFGGTLQGVQAAAYAYLGKSARELSHAEAALLVVLPQAPSRLRPDRAPRLARQARDKVLDRMADLGIWPRQVTEDAKLEVVDAGRYVPPMACPLLARRLYHRRPEHTLLETFIDADLQEQVAALARQYALRLPPNNSLAVLVVDNRDLGVKAYVGSADFQSAARFGHMDMVTALRSPGSTLKPFLYGLALDAGLIHSQSLLSDAPILSGEYRPGNFDQGFSGPVSVTQALQLSLNVPAVQVLEAFGPQSLADRLRNAGMAVVFPGDGRANLSMILGGLGTNLESLVSGFTALARGGRAGQPRLLKSDPLRERFLMSEGAAWIVRDMLRHPFPGQGRLHLAQGRPAYAWKTGTSYGFRDAWALAVNNRYTLGVWAGRPDGTPSPGQYGAATAAPLLLQTLEILGVRADQWPRPESVGETDICWPAGLAKNRCHALGLECFQEKRAWILDGQVPPTLPDPLAPFGGLVQTITVNPATGLRVDRTCTAAETRTEKIVLWPKSLEPWLPLAWRREQRIPAPDPTCGHMPDLAGSAIRIAGLAPGSRLANPSDSRRLPTVALESLGGIGRRHWYLNGRPIAVTGGREVAHHALDHPGRYQLAVVDEAGNSDMVQFEVIVQ
ncbi:MAG: penicillin-binding protein 1C [Desulfosarcinaceae bacterium]